MLKSCFLVVDPQREFCSNGFYYTKTGKDITPMINALNNIIAFLESAHSLLPLLCVRSFYKPFQFGKNKYLCIEGSLGANLALNESLFDYTFIKRQPSAFSSPQLLEYLLKNNIQQIFLAGFTTEHCIQHSCFDSQVRQFKLVLVKQMLATNSERLIMQNNFYNKVSKMSNTRIINNFDGIIDAIN
jgi:nicotinamidase-related amidase